jgi:phage terminase large subunit-like protein
MPSTLIKKIERKSKTIASHPAEIYAQQAADSLVSRELVCSKWVRLAAQRHLRDLEKAHLRGLWFDTEAAQDVLDFFSLLRHSKGEFAKEEFKLEPWEQFILWVLYGWKRADGTRRFRSAYVEVARKNGKTTILSGISLYHLVADGEEGAEVYCVATKKDQAKLVFVESERMRKASPGLAKRIESWRNNMCVPETNSKMEPLGADSDTLDGLNVSFASVDELHAHKSKALLQIIETATGARRQPLIFKITTAGHDRESVCWAERERATAILEDVKQGDDVFAFIACLDEGDDWRDESLWVKANPNLNVSVKLETLREDARKADQQPSSLNGFLRLRLNIWTNQEFAAIKIDEWNKCVGFSLKDIDSKILREQKLKELEGRECVIGIDLSSTEDVSASIKLFPPENPGEPYICIPDFWLPRDNVEEKMDKWRSNQAAYDVWAREGFLHLTDGDVIDYDEIKAQILSDCERYKVKEITFDSHFATQFTNDLQKAGVHIDKLVKFPQNWEMFNEPTQRLLDIMIPKKTIAHLGNPMLRWMASNLVVKEDDGGRKRPVKKSNAAKIDGMVALIMAIGRTISGPITQKSVYETRGVLSV